MKPLIVLLCAFGISLLVSKKLCGRLEWALSARIAMSVMLVFTAFGHFLFTQGMALMLPDVVPCKTAVIYLTGGVEVAAAIGLLTPGLRSIVAWLLILFFILILPANIYAAIKHIDYQKATFDGHGLPYLWFRIPLQGLYIVWTYLLAIKNR